MKRLTDKQRATLSTIRVARDWQVADMLSRYPDSNPSRWVLAVRLKRSFGITLNQLQALERRGLLQIRASDGSGPEVLVD